MTILGEPASSGRRGRRQSAVGTTAECPLPLTESGLPWDTKRPDGVSPTGPDDYLRRPSALMTDW